MKLRYRSGSWMLAAALLVQAPLFAQAVTLFDVNDLNFLLPLGPDGLPYPEIKVTEGNGLDPKTGEAQGQLWPAHLFEDITSRAKGSDGTAVSGHTILLDSGQAAIENWRVVGVRFIPCVLSRKTITGELFPGFPGCVTQVRLVAQPFAKTPKSPNIPVARDVSVHLVYSIGVVPAEVAKKKITFEEFLEAGVVSLGIVFDSITPRSFKCALS